MPRKKQYDYIALGMPMPVDVFATLGDLIDKAWPGSMLINPGGYEEVPKEVLARWGGAYGPQCQIVRVPRARVKGTVTKEAAQEATQKYARDAALDESRISFHGFSEDGAVQMSGAPEELQLELGAYGKAIMDGAPEGAINYLEWQVVDRATGVSTVISVSRSKGQTPHALRTKAEEKITKALKLLEGARGGSLTYEDWNDLHRQVTTALS